MIVQRGAVTAQPFTMLACAGMVKTTTLPLPLSSVARRSPPVSPA